MAEPIGYVEAFDRMVEEHKADPEKFIEIRFREGGEGFDLSLIPEEKHVREEIEGYVSIGARGFDLDSREFSSDEAEIVKLKDWISEVVWEFACR